MSWLDECEEARLCVPIEKRQLFIDLIFEGKTLGEARELCGISFDAANGIMRQQIKSTNYLKRDAE